MLFNQENSHSIQCHFFFFTTLIGAEQKAKGDFVFLSNVCQNPEVWYCMESSTHSAVVIL